MLSLTKSDELATKLNDQLETIGINRLARDSGFVRREPRKIKPLHFFVSYFITVLCDAFSYRSHAKNVGLLSSNRISKQAIFKRMNCRLLKFERPSFNQLLSRTAAAEACELRCK